MKKVDKSSFSGIKVDGKQVFKTRRSASLAQSGLLSDADLQKLINELQTEKQKAKEESKYFKDNQVKGLQNYWEGVSIGLLLAVEKAALLFKKAQEQQPEPIVIWGEPLRKNPLSDKELKKQIDACNFTDADFIEGNQYEVDKITKAKETFLFDLVKILGNSNGNVSIDKYTKVVELVNELINSLNAAELNSVSSR